MDNYYNGKIVYITGGSSGIGYAIGEELLKYGASVVLFARDRKKLEAAQRELSKTNGELKNRIGIFQLDVINPGKTEKIFAAAVKKTGVPDIVINSAGVAFSGSFESTGYDLFKSVLETNILGTRNVNYSILPFMKRRGGILVNIASLAGLIGVYGYSAYGASKYGVIGLSETLRIELKRSGISVKVVCPPEVDTPMVREEAKTIDPVAKRLKILGGVMTAEQAARYIVHKIPRKGFLIIPGFQGRATYWISRHFPWLSRTTIDLLLRFFGSSAKKNGI